MTLIGQHGFMQRIYLRFWSLPVALGSNPMMQLIFLTHLFTQ